MLPECLLAKIRALRFCNREFTELYLFISCLSLYTFGQNNLKWLIFVTLYNQLVYSGYDRTLRNIF